MNSFWNLFWIYFVILALVWLFAGCAYPQKIPNPETPKELLVDTIQKTNVPIWLCTFIIAGGCVALFNGAAKLGFSAVIYGGVSLALGLATARFGFWIAMLGLLGTVAIITYSILIKNNALKNIITGIEVFKKTYRGKENIITDATTAINSCQASTQVATTTKQIVQKIKADLKVKGEI